MTREDFDKKIKSILITKEEIDEAVAVVARQNNMTVEQLKPYFSEEFENSVRRSVMTTKVMQLIRDSAKIKNI